MQQRDGDGDPLAHAARELVRVGAEALVGRGDANAHQRLAGAGAGRLRRNALVGGDRLDDLGFHPEYRVQGGHRVLEDHRHAGAAQAPKLGLGQAR